MEGGRGVPSSQGPRGRGASSTGIDSQVGLSVESSARRRRPDQPRWPWPIVTILGGLLAVAAVWAVLTGLLAPEWLAMKGSRFSDLTSAAARIWLLAHGVPMTALGLHLTIAPLGLTAVVVAVGEETCRYGARVMSAAGRAAQIRVGWRSAARVAAVHASTHLALVVLLCGATGTSSWLRALAGGLTLGMLSGAVGAVRGARLDVAQLVPTPVRQTARGAAGGVAVVLAGAAALLAVALLGSGENVISLHRSLNPGAWGGVALLLMELAWLPDLMVWAASWLTGAGFSLGLGSAVSPFGVRLGIVPSVPVLAALPAPGAPAAGLRAWLAVPVLAGAAAAWTALRRLRGGVAGDAAVGVCTGVCVALVLGLFGAVSGGDIGSGRLVGLGADLPRMLGLAVALVGGGGLLCGLAIGIARHVRERRATGPAAGRAAGGEQKARRPRARPAPGSHSVARMRDWKDEADEDTRHTRR